MSLDVPRLDGALCAEVDPEIFFPEKGGSTQDAKSICQACDAQTDCLDFALLTGERFGIWGGQSERRRRITARERGIEPRPLAIPGSHSEISDRRDSVRRLRAQGLDGPTIAERLGVNVGVIYADFQALAAQDIDLPEIA